MDGAMAVGGMASDLLMYAMNEEQQKRLQTEQMKDNSKLQRQNQQMAVKTWNETNAEAQVNHLKNAGLNVGLMYKGGGPGGQTSSQPASVGMGQGSQPVSLSQNMMAGMSIDRQKAEIENIKADTAIKIAGLPKPAADIANVQAETGKRLQETSNAKLQGELLAIEKTMRNETLEDVIKQAAAVSDKAVGEAISARAKGEIDEATYNDKITQIKQDTAEQQLRMATQKMNINVSQNQIVKMATEINMMKQSNMRAWDAMSQTDKELQIKKLLSNAQIELMNAQELKAMTSIVTDMMSGGRTGLPSDSKSTTVERAGRRTTTTTHD